MLKRVVSVLFVGGLSFLAFVVSALAVEAGAEAGGMSGETQKWIVICAGFGMAIATVAGAISQQRGLTSALDGIARNPSAAGQMVTPMIIGLAMIESLAIYVLVVVLIVLFRNPLLEYLIKQ